MKKNNKEPEDYMKLIKLDPYNFIRDFYEELFPHMGKRVMSFLCLVPGSLLLPPFLDNNGKIINPRISVLLLSPPGTGKSSIADHFQKFTYDPFAAEYITDSKLNSVLMYKNRVTLIISDIARIFLNPIIVKQIENVIGEESKLSRFTQRTGEEESKIDAVAFFAGTLDNISRTIGEGIAFRVAPIVLFHTEKEHTEILKKVNRRIGTGMSEDFIDKEQIIINFYKQLLNNQEQNSQADLNKIYGYMIPENFRIYVENHLIPLFNEPFRETEFEFIRELQQFYKYLVNHAFLNSYNRKIKDGKLYVAEEDLKIALSLSKTEIQVKKELLKSTYVISEKRIRTIKDLKLFVYNKLRDNEAITRREYEILKSMIKG